MIDAVDTQATRSAALPTLAAALALGVLGDLLLRGVPPGINLLLWTVALVLAATLLANGYRLGGMLPDRWLLLAVGFSSCLAIRDDGALRSLNLAACAIALALVPLRHGADAKRTLLGGYVAAVARTVAHVAGGVVRLPVHDVQWRGVGSARARARLTPIAIGLVLAAPLLVVFGGLFSAADPAFKALSTRLLDWDSGPLLHHGSFALVVAWISAALMRAWLWEPAPGAPTRAGPTGRLRAESVHIAVGAMILLFAAFVGLQARALFGGDAYVHSTTGLTYAEYARSGFFELATASALVIPVLFAGDVALDAGNPGGLATFRSLASVQLLLVGIVMASALNRMRLYVLAYGLTEDRVVGTAVIVWIAAAGVAFARTTLRGRRERFTFGALASGFAVLAGLNAVSPDALVARVNTARAAAGKPVDVDLLLTLGADATPILLRAESRDVACAVVARAMSYGPSRAMDWRSWNLARARARRLITAAGSALGGCGDMHAVTLSDRRLVAGADVTVEPARAVGTKQGR